MGMSEFYGESDDASSLRTLARALELGVTPPRLIAGSFASFPGPTDRGRLLKQRGAKNAWALR